MEEIEEMEESGKEGTSPTTAGQPERVGGGEEEEAEEAAMVAGRGGKVEMGWQSSRRWRKPE